MKTQAEINLENYMKTASAVIGYELVYFDGKYHIKIADVVHRHPWEPNRNFSDLISLIKAASRKDYIRNFGINHEAIFFQLKTNTLHYPNSANGGMLTEFVFERLIELIWNLDKDKESDYA